MQEVIAAGGRPIIIACALVGAACLAALVLKTRSDQPPRLHAVCAFCWCPLFFPISLVEQFHQFYSCFCPFSDNAIAAIPRDGWFYVFNWLWQFEVPGRMSVVTSQPSAHDSHSRGWNPVPLLPIPVLVPWYPLSTFSTRSISEQHIDCAAFVSP
jgi:hypothetical protein